MSGALGPIGPMAGGVGPTGPTGATGPTGPGPSFSTTADSFVVPAVGDSVPVEVDDTTWMPHGPDLFDVAVQDCGVLRIVSVADGTHVTLKNLSYSGASAGATIAANKTVTLAGVRGAQGTSSPLSSFLWTWTRPADAAAGTTTAAAEIPPIMVYDQDGPWDIGAGIIRFTTPLTPNNTNYATFKFDVYDATDALLGTAFEVATTVTNLGASPVTAILLPDWIPIGGVTTFGDGNSIRPSVTKAGGGVQVSQVAVTIRIDRP